MTDMPHGFNLIDASWLPVRRRSGAIERIAPWRINDRIGEDPIVAFAWPRPDFNGAAHEFLIGLLSTAAAPEDDDDWEYWWWEPPKPEILRERFAQVARAFNLDGPGPRFLQDLDPLEDGKEKEVAALLVDAPGEDTVKKNADLFVKRGGAPILCRATAAMALYTLNTYAPSGGGGGGGHMTSLRGGGPMTTLIVANHRDYGTTLWGRVWPNIETREQIEARASGTGASSVFPWLVPTRTPSKGTGKLKTTPSDAHPLQVYWGMPRRIRLVFESAQDRSCSLTGDKDSTVVTTFRTKTRGTDYSEGFEHPLTPYRRQKAGSPKLPVHPKPGGISYRLWPGLVFESSDKLSDPAQVVRHWRHERAPRRDGMRLTAFGYDMDNMKARAWIESEMPFWLMEDTASREELEKFIRHAVAGADTVNRLLTKEIKTALYGQPPKKKTNRSYEPPKKMSGDFGFIAERFYRETEPAFYAALREVGRAIEEDPDGVAPTLRTREDWAPIMADAAMRLFDEYAPMDGLEGRNMERHVEAHFFLTLALGGRGKDGYSLFERDLGIASPETARVRKGRKEAA